MNKNTKIVLAIVALVAVIGIFLGVYFATRPETQAGAKEITVVVVHKNGSQKTFTYHTDEEYLGPFLMDEGLLKGEQGTYGLYITQVDGEMADYASDQSYWAFYQADEYALQGVDRTSISDGDEFSFVYTIG